MSGCPSEGLFQGVCLRCTLLRVQRFAFWLRLTEAEPKPVERTRPDSTWAGA